MSSASFLTVLLPQKAGGRILAQPKFHWVALYSIILKRKFSVSTYLKRQRCYLNYSHTGQGHCYEIQRRKSAPKTTQTHEDVNLLSRAGWGRDQSITRWSVSVQDEWEEKLERESSRNKSLMIMKDGEFFPINKISRILVCQKLSLWPKEEAKQSKGSKDLD